MILNLDPEINEDELKELFQTDIGPVRSVVITTNAAGTQVRLCPLPFDVHRALWLVHSACACACRRTARWCTSVMRMH